MSQGELAKRIEMYASDISKMENTTYRPTVTAVAEALGVSADHLLGLIHDTPVAVAAAPQLPGVKSRLPR
jgi:hypothetical protein